MAEKFYSTEDMNLTQTDMPERDSIHHTVLSLDIDALLALLERDENETLSNHRNSEDLTPLHLLIQGVNNENLDLTFTAIKILMQFKADLNLPCKTLLSHTPFTLLVKKFTGINNDSKKTEILDYIKTHALFIDICTYHEYETKKLLINNYPALFDHLTIGNYDGLSKNKIISKLCNHLDTSQSKFFQELYTLHHNPKYQKHINEILELGGLLQEMIKRGLTDGAKELINLNEKTPNIFEEVQNPAMYDACLYGRWEILQMLLEKLPQYNHTMPLLHYTLENYKVPNFYPPESDHDKTIDLLLAHPNIDNNELDVYDHTALHYAIRGKNINSAKKLLATHTFIGSIKKIHIPPIQQMTPSLLEEYFDSCITENEFNPADNQYELKFNYSCLKSPISKTKLLSSAKDYNFELSTIQFLAHSDKFKHLIQHPFITSFLYLKWYQVRSVFYANLMIYFISCLALLAYLVVLEEHSDESVLSITLKWMSFAGALYVLFREFCQLVVMRKRYFYHPENYLEVSLIIFTSLVLFGENCFGENTRRTVEGVTILCVVAEVTILIASMPIFSISTYMVMLKKVTMTFIKLLSIYSVILTAFALCFHAFFGEANGGDIKNDTIIDREEKARISFNRFDNPWLAIVKTIVMFAGELDASSIHFHNNVIGYIVFIIFVFFISIVMMNLLSALAVSDIQKVKVEIASNYWIELAKMLSKYESIKKPLFRYLWPGLQEFFPDLLPKNTITVKVNGIPSNHIIIPSNELETVICGQPQTEDCKVLTEYLSVTPFTVLDQRIVVDAILVIAKFKERNIRDLEKATATELMKRMDDMLKKMDTKNR